MNDIREIQNRVNNDILEQISLTTNKETIEQLISLYNRTNKATEKFITVKEELIQLEEEKHYFIEEMLDFLD